MVRSVSVVGAGRVGSAVAARLAERGLELRGEGAELILLCVPDRAIAEVAASITPRLRLAHVSGATTLAELRARRPELEPVYRALAEATTP
jgi:hypothetical protein